MQSLPREQKAALLVEADSLRDGSADDLRRVQICYLALGADLDAKRLRWLLLSRAPRDAAMESLARTVARTAPKLAPLARLVLAQCMGAAGRLTEAEARAREVFASCYGSDKDLEARAAATLALVYAGQGREFEALAFARYAESMLPRLKDVDPHLQCIALQRVCNAYGVLDARAEIAPVLDRLEKAARAAAPDTQATLLMWSLGTRAEQAALAGDADAAKQHLDRMRPRVPAQLQAEFALLEATVHLHAERYEEALDTLRSAVAGTPVHGIRLALGVARALRHLNRHDESSSRLRDGFAALRTGFDEGLLGSGRTLRLALAAAELLDDDAEALDLAARASVRRCREIERFVRTTPTMQDFDATELRRYRREFRAQNERLLEVVKQHVARHGFPIAAASGDLEICPWCLRVRMPDRSWLPIGHFFPDDLPAFTASGVCIECAGASR